MLKWCDIYPLVPPVPPSIIELCDIKPLVLTLKLCDINPLVPTVLL